jgi:predicted aspartyl protease
MVTTIGNISENSIAPGNRKPYYISIHVNGHSCKAFVDTGSHLTLMSENLAKKLKLRPKPSDHQSAQGITGHRVDILGIVQPTMTIGDCSMQGKTAVMRSCPYEVLIGRDLLSQIGAFTIDLEKEYMQFGKTRLPIGEPLCPP